MAATTAQRIIFLISALLLGVLMWFAFADRPASPPSPASLLSESSSEAVTARPTASAITQGTETASASMPQRTKTPDSSQAIRGPNTVHITGKVCDRMDQPIAGASVRIRSITKSSVNAQTQTRSDGSFEVDLATRSIIVIAVRSTQFAAGQFHRDVPDHHDLLELGTLMVGRGGSITGQVVDASGIGIANASATLQPDRTNKLVWAEDRDILFPPITTNSLGQFRFERVPASKYRLDINADGFSTASPPPSVDALDDVTRDLGKIVLQEGCTLQGTVFAADGKTVANAMITLRNTGRDAIRSSIAKRTTTDSSGHFQIEHLPLSEYRIVARAKGQLTWRRDDLNTNTERSLDIHLETGLCVTGIVVDAKTGAPIENFASHIRRIGTIPQVSAKQHRERTQSSIKAITEALSEHALLSKDRDRLERLRELRQASLARVDSPNLSSHSDRLHHHKTIQLDLGPSTPHPKGRFSFEGLEEGVYMVYVKDRDHMRAESDLITVQRTRSTPALRLLLRQGLSITGRVLNSQGHPIAGARVALQTGTAGNPYAQELDHKQTDPDGVFRIDHCRPGMFTLAASHPEAANTKSEPFLLETDDHELDIVMPSLAKLRGRVSAPPSHEDQAISVLILQAGGRAGRKISRATSDGRYQFDNIQPGAYITRAFAGTEQNYLALRLRDLYTAGRNPTPSDVRVQAGQTTVHDLELDIPPVGALEGQTSHNGKPGRDLSVRLKRIGSPHRSYGTRGVLCDVKGEFKFEGLLAGTYELSINLQTEPNRPPLQRRTIVITRETTRREIIEIRTVRLQASLISTADPKTLQGTLVIFHGLSSEPLAGDLSANANATRVPIKAGRIDSSGILIGPAWVQVLAEGQSHKGLAINITAGQPLELELVTAKD